MTKTSVERRPQRPIGAIAALGSGIAFAVACSGGAEFSRGRSHDPDASAGSGGSGSDGGATGSGGRVTTGGAGSGANPSTTGGSGNGGNGGTSRPDAGDAGAIPPPACTRNADCEPFACGGVAKCEDGACAPGGPCPGPDGGACVNECVRTATGASCVTMGRDEDHDGHRDARCRESPGDDCDDTRPAVHGAAAETCDGLDNDCNQQVDAFDGVALSGAPFVVTDVANTAQLALVKRNSGYALMTNEMVDYYAGLGNPTDVRLLGFDGTTQQTVRVSGSLNVIDPALTSIGETLVVFGFRNTGTENVLTMARRIAAEGALQEEFAIPKAVAGAQVWGRAVATRPDGGVLFAWAEHPAAQGQPAGGIVYSILSAGGASNAMYVANLEPGAGTIRAYRPNIVVTGPETFAVAWAERKLAASGMVTFLIHLSYLSSGTSAFHDVLIDTYQLPSQNTQLQGESARPQVTFDGVAYTVGSLGPDRSLRVRRVSAGGVPLCVPKQIPEVLAWGAGGSLASTRQGTVAIATATNGDVMLYRVSDGVSADEPCMVQRTAALNQPQKRVASSPTFEKGELKASLGDPVVLVGKDDALVTAWVERDRTKSEADAVGASVQTPAEPNRVVMRLLGRNFCE